MKNLFFLFLFFLFAGCGQEKPAQDQTGSGTDTLTAEKKSTATKARVTGSSVIIRSEHTTESSSVGVVANEGTIVQILDVYTSGNSNEAILKRSVTVIRNGDRIKLPPGKAIRILSDRNDSVQASFYTANHGMVEASISKNDIEAMSGRKWYKIYTTDDITGWIYGEFIEEL